LQRYRCCACGRTFNDLTGTPLARLRLKSKWLAYSHVLLDSISVRKAADRVGRAPQHGLSMAPPLSALGQA
jgi:transposase-like protein